MKTTDFILIAALFFSVFIAISASASDGRSYNRVSELLNDEAYSGQTDRSSRLGAGKPFISERISNLLSDEPPSLLSIPPLKSATIFLLFRS